MAKKWMLALVAVMMLCGLVCMGPAAATAQDAAEIAGDWAVSGAWLIPPPMAKWDFVWTITQDGPLFEVSSTSGAVGNGFTVSSLMLFRFDGGCLPMYIGMVTEGSMQGLMLCTSGEGIGMWKGAPVVTGGKVKTSRGTASEVGK